MSRKRINAEPLYNHSRRAFISHQIATSTGPTLTGRAHSHLTTSWIDAPEEDVVDEDVDMDLPDLMPMEDSDDEDEDGGTRPGIKVIATKVPAKRYTNSVSNFTFLVYLSAHFQPGRPFGNLAPLS